jgi:general secretion pathway protein J|tara:strand:- start:2099 stop:2689 length:591 start_codon:yes stop_codon:yes gene_type:complete
MKTTASHGFTLVETLVALFVFAIVAGASTFVFGQTVEASRGIEETSQELQELQRTRAALRSDLAQMAVRVTRDTDGNPRPRIDGGEGQDMLIAFARRGPDRSDREGRPSMEYVEWSAGPEGLTRRAAPFLDGAEFGPPAVLLPGAQNVEIEFHLEGAWNERPMTANGDALPDAVRLTLTHPRFGRTEQLFLTGVPS